MLAIGTYLKLVDFQGSDTGYAFQNFFQGESRTYLGTSYVFAGFGFSGGTLDLQAANISAAVVFAVNQLDLNIFQTASDQRWLAEIRTVWLDPDTLVETNRYSEELYAVLGFEHDTSRLQVRLGNPLDAIEANIPRRVLTQVSVGELPSTGNISLR